MTPREEATAFILKHIEMMLPGSENTTYWKERLNSMSDRQFADFMDKLETGEQTLSLVVPNLSKPKLKIETLLEVAKKLKVEIFQRLYKTDPNTGKRYLTPVRYMTGVMPFRRQVQLLQKKISIPEDNRHIDELSGQPTGPSKGSKVSFPELQVLDAQDINGLLPELLKFRGGDIEAGRALERQVIQTGQGTMSSIPAGATKVRSNETLSTLLKGAHLDNNL